MDPSRRELAPVPRSDLQPYHAPGSRRHIWPIIHSAQGVTGPVPATTGPPVATADPPAATAGPPAISEILLRDLSQKLGAEWKMVGTYLRFETAKIEQLMEQHHHHVKECIFQMLLQWRNAAGKAATKEKLKKAFKKSGRSDLCEVIDNPDDD